VTSEPRTALRFERRDGSWFRAAEPLQAVTEVPVALEVEGVGRFTIMALPLELRALALGFLAAEGLIASRGDVAELREDPGMPHTLAVRLAAPPAGRPPRHDVTIVTGGARTASPAVPDTIAGLPTVGGTFRTTADAILAAYEGMCARQVIRQETRATHAAALFDARGEVLACAEDVGRHNAVDKVVGRMLLESRSAAGLGMMLSGRVSLEMAAKCARAGVELVAAVSAPTALGIATAERCGMTLCVFVGSGSLTVLTHPGRIHEEG
jgi:FdhD protein